MLMMLPFEAPTIFEGIHKSYFRMPRVVKDQRSKFENDDLFRQLSHESAVKYTGFKDRPLEERQMKFIANCQEGHTEVSVVQSGNQFTLMFNPTVNPAYNNEGCDFDKELGKVHLKAGFILNGVCVFWRGWIDLQRLEGFGSVEFDEYRAYLEDALLKQQLEKQQTCNASANQHPPPPLGRLNPPPPHPLAPAHLAVSAPAGLGGCLNPGALGPPGLAADTAAHYGNAAIAAAAAAAFHQALGVGGPGVGLHGLGAAGPPGVALSAASAVGAGLPAGHAPNPLAYANGGAQSPPGSMKATSGNHPARTSSSSPPDSNSNSNNSNNSITPNANLISLSNGHSALFSQDQNVRPATNSSNVAAAAAATNSNSHTPAPRQPVKRPAPIEDDQTNVDDVDVVSDIHANELEFPPRRMFKSDPISSNTNLNSTAHHSSPHPHHHHHHHNHYGHQHHHRATRRV